MKDGVNHLLKGGRGMAEADKHNHGFVETMICDEGSFSLISISDANVVETLVNINN
jgi:hypothetical protein